MFLGRFGLRIKWMIPSLNIFKGRLLNKIRLLLEKSHFSALNHHLFISYEEFIIGNVTKNWFKFLGQKSTKNWYLIRGCLHETRNECSFCHEKISVYISFRCGRNKVKFSFALVFWSTIFVFMRHSHAQIFPFGWFHYGVVLT